MSDPVNPKHYHGTKVDEFVEEFKLGFRLGNTIKYIARHQDKGTPLQDLKKARWYLDREIQRMEELATLTVATLTVVAMCPATKAPCTCPCVGAQCLRLEPGFQENTQSCDLHQWKGHLDQRCPKCAQTKEHHNAG